MLPSPSSELLACFPTSDLASWSTGFETPLSRHKDRTVPQHTRRHQAQSSSGAGIGPVGSSLLSLLRGFSAYVHIRLPLRQRTRPWPRGFVALGLVVLLHRSAFWPSSTLGSFAFAGHSSGLGPIVTGGNSIGSGSGVRSMRYCASRR